MADPPSHRRESALPPGVAPRYLSRQEAAAYLGVSPETFDGEVRRGWWPPARTRGEKGRRLTWDIKALDHYADRAAGLCLAPETPPAPANDLTEEAAIQGAINAAASHKRDQRRRAPAR